MLTAADARLGALGPRALSNLLLALGALGFKPNKEFMAPALKRAYQLLKCAWGPGGGASAARAFAAAAHLRGAYPARRQCRRPLLTLPHPPRPAPPRPARSKLNVIDLERLVTGLAAMRYTPNQAWLDAFAAAADARAEHMSAARLAAVGAALRRLGYASGKPQAWVAER